MRATIDLPEDLRAAVLQIAARKGYRGYSRVIVEALEYYIADKEQRNDLLDEILRMRGTWNAEECEGAET